DERILHFLAGSNVLDPRLQSFVRDCPSPGWIADEQRDTAVHAARLLENYAEYSPLVHLCGDDRLGHEDIAAVAAHELRRRLVVVSADALPAIGPDLDQFALLWERESLLLPGALLVQAAATELSTAATHLLERLPGVVFVSTPEPVRFNRGFVRFDANKPGPVQQKMLWSRALGDAAASLNRILDDFSEQFRLSARLISSTGYLLRSREEPPQPDDLWNACRSLARPRLDDLAQRIVPAATWDDLVLPELQKTMLRQLAT